MPGGGRNAAVPPDTGFQVILYASNILSKWIIFIQFYRFFMIQVYIYYPLFIFKSGYPVRSS